VEDALGEGRYALPYVASGLVSAFPKKNNEREEKWAPPAPSPGGCAESEPADAGIATGITDAATTIQDAATSWISSPRL
jgi:hypothetical protein